ncbi:MAG: hypothetical protein LUG98_14395 [Tannerellaceae bacterium]|nr:hypothetical protein [Tannerellaceae bacterium]
MKRYKPCVAVFLFLLSSLLWACDKDKENEKEEEKGNRIEFEDQVYPITQAIQTYYGISPEGSHTVLLEFQSGSDAILKIAMFTGSSKLVAGTYTQDSHFVAYTFTEGILQLKNDNDKKEMETGKVEVRVVDDLYTIYVEGTCQNSSMVKAWYEGKLDYRENSGQTCPCGCDCSAGCSCDGSGPCSDSCTCSPVQPEPCPCGCGCSEECTCAETAPCSESCTCFTPPPTPVQNLFSCQKGEYAISGGTQEYKPAGYGGNYPMDNIDVILYYEDEYKLKIYFELFQEGGPHLKPGTYTFIDSTDEIREFSILNYYFSLTEGGRQYDLAPEGGILTIEKADEIYTIRGEFSMDDNTPSTLTYQGTLEIK